MGNTSGRFANGLFFSRGRPGTLNTCHSRKRRSLPVHNCMAITGSGTSCGHCTTLTTHGLYFTYAVGSSTLYGWPAGWSVCTRNSLTHKTILLTSRVSRKCTLLRGSRSRDRLLGTSRLIRSLPMRRLWDESLHKGLGERPMTCCTLTCTNNGNTRNDVQGRSTFPSSFTQIRTSSIRVTGEGKETIVRMTTVLYRNLR